MFQQEKLNYEVMGAYKITMVFLRICFFHLNLYLHIVDTVFEK